MKFKSFPTFYEITKFRNNIQKTAQELVLRGIQYVHID